MIKNIIFDFNGTIINDVDVSLDALNACIEKYVENGKPLSKKYYLDHFSFPVIYFYESVGFNFDKVDYNELANYFYKYYESRAFKECGLYPGLVELLTNLKEKGYRIFILSATYLDLLKVQLDYYKIFQYFDGLIAQENKYALSKEEIGRRAFIKYNIDPSETLMIGDTLHDVEVANALNINTVVSFDQGHNSKEQLLTKNKNIISNYNELFNYINN